MYEVNSCYKNGNLAKALEEAAEFVRRIGEESILHVFSRQDGDIPDTWWVEVVYLERHQRQNVLGVSMPHEWTTP